MASTKARKTVRDIKRHHNKLLLARSAMRAHFLILRTNKKTKAHTPEGFYGFKAEDVIELYVRKVGYGAGLWFRLKDGRVFDAFGKRSGRTARYIPKPIPNTPVRRIIPDDASQIPMVTPDRLWHPQSHSLSWRGTAMAKISDLPRHAIPDEVLRNIAHETMHRHFRALSDKGKNRGAGTPEKFYGFRAGDVDEMHFHKHGFGEGVWYRLKDGRVIDALGNASEPERLWYTKKAN